MNILIVDDNETNRKLLRVTLEAEGLRVVEASDGVEALAVLDRARVDAIISDILMPRMDGYRLCYEVRASNRFHQLPFVVYTNTFDSRGDEKAALEMGADKFLRKPAQVKQITGALDELLGGPPTGHPRLATAPHQLELMKEYSEVLVKKLIQKNSELQLAAEQLTQMNQVLSSQAAELARAKEDLSNANVDLELRVRERTAQL